MSWKKIQGYVTEGQAEIFDRLIEDLPIGATIVEVGSWKGRSAVLFGELVQKHGKRAHIYCVDHFLGRDRNAVGIYKEFQRNVRRNDMSNIIKPIVGDSIEVGTQFPDKIDFWFYDADHTVMGTIKAFDVWSPHFNEKCVAVFHNYNWEHPEYNVKAAIEQLRPKMPGMYTIKEMAIWKRGY